MLDVQFNGGLTEREFKALGLSSEDLAADFAAIARADRDFYLEENRKALHARVGVIDITDRKRGAPPESVTMPGGLYIAEYELASGVVRRALEILDEVSPIRTGRYVHSHAVYVGGTEIHEPYDVGDAGEIVIASKLVYSRKLEKQWGSPRVSSKTPQGPYWVTASRLSREFRGSFTAKFTFWGSEMPKRRGKLPRGDIGKYPVLIIRPV